MKPTVAIVLLLAFSASPALAAGLAPHRAVYDLSLVPGGTGLSDAAPDMSGRMVYEFTGAACEGYTTNFRFVVESTDEDGNRSVTDLRTSNHEDADGAHFQFVSQTYTNNVLTDDVKGTAAKADGLTVTLTGRDKPLKFPDAAIFPTAHLEAMIAAGKAGDRVLQKDIFDGSEGGDKVYRTTTVIGAERDDAATGAAAALGAMPHWPVTVSYFDPTATGDQTPDYTISFQLWENGVSTDLTMDYGDFALSGALTTYETLPPSDCD